MSISYAKRAKKKADIKRRAEAPGDGDTKCYAWGCKNLTQRAEGSGLSEFYCKRHVEFKRRHGSAHRRSYTRKELAPFLKATRKWLSLHRGGQGVAGIVEDLNTLLFVQDRAPEAQEVRWMSPKRKARAALARFREAGKSAEDLLEIALMVEVANSVLGPRDSEFRDVQIAKQVHRVGSGTHKVTSAGVKLPPRWPRSEGAVLRILGEMVRERARVTDIPGAVEWVTKVTTG